MTDSCVRVPMCVCVSVCVHVREDGKGWLSDTRDETSSRESFGGCRESITVVNPRAEVKH